MVQDGKAGLTEAIVTSLSHAILFYGWWLLGEGLTLSEAWDAAFMLSGALSWVGKHVQLSAKPASLGYGWWLITHAITEGQIEPRGPICPHSIPSTSTPFNFHNQDLSPQPGNIPVVAEQWEVPRLSPHLAHLEQGWACHQSQDRDHRWRELWRVPPQSPSLLSDRGLKSDASSASTSSSVASVSEGSGGSRHPHWLLVS